MSDSMVPPTKASFEPEPIQPKWPTVIGVFSIIYALGGLLCQLAFGAMMAFNQQIPEQFRGGVNIPPAIQIIGLIQVLFTSVAGIVLLIGAIKLVQRRRAGHSMLRAWAMIRMILLVIGVAVAIFTGPAQIQMQRDSIEWQKRYFAEHNINQPVPDYTDDQLWRRVILNNAVFAGVVAVYPIFIVFYLSRKKILHQVQDWRK